MAWNPFDKSAAEAPTTELPPVDVPVADATAIVPPVPAPQSENLRRAFEAAQRSKRMLLVHRPDAAGELPQGQRQQIA